MGSKYLSYSSRLDFLCRLHLCCTYVCHRWHFHKNADAAAWVQHKEMPVFMDG